MQIGIGNHQHIVRRRRQHIDQVGHFGIPPMPGRIHHNGDVAIGKPSLQPPNHRQRRVGRVLHAKYHLPRRKILAADAGQCVLQQWFVPMQRLQHADTRRHPSPDQQRPIDKPPHCRPARNGLHHADP
jgi:hypothetical protein